MTPQEFEPRYLVLEHRDALVIASVRVATLTEDMNLEQFGHELFALVEQLGCRKLVVNMRDVQMVTSAGLGKMIALHRKMHRVQGIVVFCHVQPAVEEILRNSRLITYLNVKSDLDSATGMVGA